jgi:hypothetical protein
MENTKTRSIEKGLIDLCLFVHTEFHSCSSDINESVLELSDILKLDSNGALSFLKDTLT